MFIPNPNINKTELLKSFIQMERKLRIIWHHYKTDAEHGVEEYKEDYKYPIPLAPLKINLERLKLPPKPLLEFIHGIKGEIKAATPRRLFSNLTKEETKALKDLNRMQKNGMIVVIRTDKSGGFAIVTRKDYQSEMLKILNSTIGKDGSEEKCYDKVDQDIIIRHYLSIKEIVKEGLNRELYNKRVADNLIQNNLKLVDYMVH